MEQMIERVAVLGLGYVGLPVAAMLASHGIQVTGIDINAQLVATLNQGDIHIEEPELAELVRQVVLSGLLRAVTKPVTAQIFIIAVPTPVDDDKHADLSHVQAAVHAIAPLLQAGNLVILESTSPPGTTHKVSEWLAAARNDLRLPHEYGEDADIQLAYCPERVLPGKIIPELKSNDRIIGGLTPYCAQRAQALYKIIVQGQCVITDAKTAEMSKLAENAFRDVNIAFANELALICEHLGVDAWEMIELANRHPRVNILQPGPGVGGHCISVDPWFIVDSAPQQAQLVLCARNVNDNKPSHVLAQIKAVLNTTGTTTVACLGLSFKADVDDLRESPALIIAGELAQMKEVTVLAVEPHISQLPASCSAREQIQLVDLNEALAQAEVLVLLVAHTDFKTISKKQLAKKIVIDTCGGFRAKKSVTKKQKDIGIATSIY